MALPISPNTDLYRKPPEGISRIDAIMQEDTAKQERNKYPDMKWLGSGGFGVTVESRPDEVLKYTKDEMEVQRASWAYKNKPEWIVPIFSFPQQIQKDPPLWALRMKKLELLNREEQELITTLTLYFEDNFGQLPTLWEVVQNLAPSLEEKQVADLYHQIAVLLKENEETLQLDDIHGGNVGRDQGKIKVFDLGVGSSL